MSNLNLKAQMFAKVEKISQFAEKRVVLLLPCLIAVLFVCGFYALIGLFRAPSAF